MLGANVGDDRGPVAVDDEAVCTDEVLRGVETGEQPADVVDVGVDRESPGGGSGS